MIQILQGDWIERLRELPDESAQCCVTSPPYFGLRDYKVAGQVGLEATPADYTATLVSGFREVRRVLRDDGVLWLNLGDSYAGSRCGPNGDETTGRHVVQSDTFIKSKREGKRWGGGDVKCPGVKTKDLIGIPWLVAFALRADGWYLRCDIIWSKPNPIPESVTDRPTKAHEYIFLLTKAAKYYYDHEAIKDAPSPELIKQIGDGYNGKALKDYLGASVQDASATKGRIIDGYRKRIDKQRGHGRRHNGFNDKWDALTPTEQAACGRNKRSVWTVPPANYDEAHFATFPPALITPCILAGSKPGDIILDPFGGSGTTGQVALELGRKAILIELNPDYIKLIEKRTDVTIGLPL